VVATLNVAHDRCELVRVERSVCVDQAYSLGASPAVATPLELESGAFGRRFGRSVLLEQICKDRTLSANRVSRR